MSKETGNPQIDPDSSPPPRRQEPVDQLSDSSLAASADLDQRPVDSTALHSHMNVDFFASYPSTPGRYDELRDASGTIRPEWESLRTGLNQIGAEGLQRRNRQIQRSIHQNGIAYSAYGDPSVRQEHPTLDPVPFVIGSAQWAFIESALAQRARLLNLILADLFGERKLITSGLLPAEVLLDHPGYRLPLHNLSLPAGKHLHFYSATIARSPNGDWWVMSDHTGTPGGCGFALENRAVISREFPAEFQQLHVQRLAAGFSLLREQLVSLAPGGKSTPHIAILSRGAGQPGYFEDSFLARYLGISIVQAKDLVVRSGHVMLKTLGGLETVDVIYRRQPSIGLDPLELGGAGLAGPDASGIPGLLQVIRAGNVAVVNAPGSSLVQSPVFMAFMPRICNQLLNTKLSIPGIATWWAGEPASLPLILDRIDELQLKPAFEDLQDSAIRGSGDVQRIDPATMNRTARIELVQRNPSGWVAQEKIIRSTSPVWDHGTLTPRAVTLRTFLHTTASSWTAIPGALVKTSPLAIDDADSGNPDRALPVPGEGTKDAWVLSESPATRAHPTNRPGNLLQPTRREGYLPSRIADNLFWLGRYLERTGARARLFRAVVTRLTDESGPDSAVELPVLLRSIPLFPATGQATPFQNPASSFPELSIQLPAKALDPNDAMSLSSTVERIVFLTGSLRDRLTADVWRIAREMSSRLAESRRETCDLTDLLDITDSLLFQLSAFSGFVGENMTRTHAFQFLNIGRRIEHGLQSAGLLNFCFASGGVPVELLESLLEISDSRLTYRSRYFANFQLHTVLDLLVTDDSNPQSLIYQLLRLDDNLRGLPGNSEEQQKSAARKIGSQLIESARTADVWELSRTNDSGERAALVRFFANVQNRLPEIARLVSNRFLVHSGKVQRLIAKDFC